MEKLNDKETLIIQSCIAFVLAAHEAGYAKFENEAKKEDLENLLKKLRGER